ncbi:hypothetical protein APUTEX25_005010 [Auxenochlorella protothecoides]|uniref:RNA polymerase Rpb4/RPC9 core domain-containing protein n=1 Tax=Auxenochlorella protothecoides TaxID=3075 RepID=A0A3M7L2L8_AUXPR|nr:hypothetical protein APUTEX25_005010 [Auxenochlorella protothecoides]|eukprot:RMZ56948.1 hypothetical protein APUTEX25_005010 [Auxenochlorella protothecoides]
MADDNSTDSAVFKDAKILNISEVNLVFEKYLEHMRQRDPEYQTNALMEKSMELLAQHHFTEQELGLMTNLQPMTPDEVFKLIPSLDDESRFSGNDIQRIIAELAQYSEVK